MMHDDFSRLPVDEAQEEQAHFWSTWGLATALGVAALAVAVFVGLMLLVTRFGLGWQRLTPRYSDTPAASRAFARSK